MPTLHLRRTSLFWFHRAWSWVEFSAASCFVCVCLFVCYFFQLLKWVIFLFLSLTSGWGFLVFFVFVLFCYSFKMFHFPTIYLESGWFFFFFLSRRLVKFFCFLFCLFICFNFVLFCFFFFFSLFFVFLFFLLPKIPSPLNIKIWCALIVILLHKWWWTLHHRQFWIPVTCVQFSEKSNFNLKLH